MLEFVMEIYLLIILKIEVSKSIERYLYFVINYCCGGEVFDEFKKFLIDDEFSYLLFVGVVMVLLLEINCLIFDIFGYVFCVFFLLV